MPLPAENMFFGYADKLTDEQRTYVDSMFDNQLTIVNARSGTGKTTLAVMCAKVLKMDLVYIFSPVSEGLMGFRPGSQKMKEEEYLQPLKDALLEINENPFQVIFNEDLMIPSVDKSKKLIEKLTKDVWVYPMSHVFARGTNIKNNKLVILDEFQNFTKSEIRKILTRIHDDVKVVMIGHTGQCDLKNPKDSGFQAYIEHFKDKEYAKVCELTWNFRGRLAHDSDQIT